MAKQRGKKPPQPKKPTQPAAPQKPVAGGAQKNRRGK